MIKKFNNLPIFVKTVSVVMLVLTLKLFILANFYFENSPLNELVPANEITIVFTGAFFVFGLMMAASMTDFKESEKIPGEIANCFETMVDWINYGMHSRRISNTANFQFQIDYELVKKEVLSSISEIHDWMHCDQKSTQEMGDSVKRLSDLSNYLAERNFDLAACKSILDNASVIRKQLTRVYSISKTRFIEPAYLLLRFIIGLVTTILLLAKFNSPFADILVTISASFIINYIYFLISGLDDPFDHPNGETEIDLRPIKNTIERMDKFFLAE
jgi:hypothetical protein